MQKVYSRINWENDPSTNTPINEDNLNKMDYALDQIDDRVINLSGYETRVAESEKNAKAQSLAADEKAQLAEQQALMAESYTHGSTGLRANEAVDNAQYYLEQAKQLSQSMNGLIPMGTISFADLSLSANQVQKYMFNISDEFVTDATFKEGAGHSFPAGTNVFRTNDGYWDCLAGSFQTPNGDTKDNIITFTKTTSISEIISGEKFSVIFGKIAKAIEVLINHLSNFQNPHGVTKNQVGLGNVDNTADSNKSVKYAISAGSAPASDVYDWAKKENKPSYSKSEVGLGNVPNVATNDQTPTFAVASTRANILSGEKFSVILGKIMKFFADLKTVAFSGSYNDLSNKPTIPSKVASTQIKYQYLPTAKTVYEVSLGNYDFYTWTINIGGIFRNSIIIPSALAKDPSIIHQVDFVTSGTPYWAAFQYVNETTVYMWTNYSGTIIGYIYGYKLS